MKSFLAGRKSLSTPPLRPPPTHTHPRRTPAATGGVRPVSQGPVVDVVKEGDKVVRIVVTCGCGERIEVECLYTAGA